MSDVCTLTLKVFEMWSDDALRCFLSIRAKSTAGSSSELAARAFIAWEENIPPNADAEHRQCENLYDYTKKLIINDIVVSDPFGLHDGWLEETRKSMSLWPAVFFTDIADFLCQKTSAGFAERLCSEYKQGKAYRSVWLYLLQ